MLLITMVTMLMLVISSSQSQSRNPSHNGADKAGNFLLDVLCRQDVMVVAVNSEIVVEDRNVGVHVVVLDQTRGKLLHHRFLDVNHRKFIFWSEMLVEFLNTIRDGRMVVIGTQGISSVMMSNATQLHLTLLGSQHVKELTGRGQWAMAVEKGFPVLAEARSSPTGSDISEGQVHLHVQVDLKLDEDVDSLKSGDLESMKVDTCNNLLRSGHLGEFNEWHPDGCHMHQYTSADAATCFQRVKDGGGKTHIAFLGDSRMRNIYGTLIHIVDPSDKVARGEINKWGNHVFVDTEAKVLFEYFKSGYVDANMTKYLNPWRTQRDIPKLIVSGVASWAAREFKGERRGVEEYASNLTLLVPTVDDLTRKGSSVIWALQAPVVYDRLKVNNKYLTNEQIALYNDAAIKALRPSTARLWSSIRRIGEGNLSGSTDGVHQGELALVQKAQILLNFYCNQHMPWSDDTICCT